MRPTLAALIAPLGAALAPSTPAFAQWCDCGAGAPIEAGPAAVVVPQIVYVRHTAYRLRTVLVPRTRLVRRVVYVRRTRLVPRLAEVPQTVYSAHTGYAGYPAIVAYGGGYPVGYRYGATYVPPGAAYGCSLGTVGCDSSFVGPLGGLGVD